MPVRYHSFQDLPEDMRQAMVRLWPQTYENELHRPIPYLEDQSILDALNADTDGSGHLVVRQYLHAHTRAQHGEPFCT